MFLRGFGRHTAKIDTSADGKRTVDRGAEEELGKTWEGDEPVGETGGEGVSSADDKATVDLGAEDEPGETGEEGVSIETLEHVMDCLERTTNERVVDPFDDDEVVEGIAALYDWPHSLIRIILWTMDDASDSVTQ
jgi:hypothetical protein